MKDKGSALYQITLLILSIYVLLTLILESFFIANDETREILQFIDLIICGVFLFDFFYNLFTAKNKLRYLKWGWIDFISSIPMLDPLRWGRLARVVRIIRVLRAIRSSKILLQTVFKNKVQSLSLSVFMIVFFTFSISAVLILEFERGFGSDLSTSKGALWWAFLNLLNAKVSINEAQSSGGEIVTLILNKVGLLVFAYVNSLIIAWLIKKNKVNQKPNS